MIFLCFFSSVSKPSEAIQISYDAFCEHVRFHVSFVQSTAFDDEEFNDDVKPLVFETAFGFLDHYTCLFIRTLMHCIGQRDFSKHLLSGQEVDGMRT